jgi:hypothetical protein
MTHSMRGCATLLALVLVCALSSASDEPKKKAPPRFGFDVDETTYPQKTPAETMKSIGIAIDRKRLDYMLAQMADPRHVDYWVEQYKADFPQGKEAGKRLLAFDRLVRETDLYFQNDPLIVKDLRIFAKEAKWTEDGELATGAVDTIPARKIFLRKIGDRWFLKNEQQEKVKE